MGKNNKIIFVSLFLVFALAGCGHTPASSSAAAASSPAGSSFSSSVSSSRESTTISSGKQERRLSDFVYSVSPNSIQVNPIDDGLYKIDEGSWQNTGLFESLNANQEYLVSVKQKETTIYLESNTVSKKIMTSKNEQYNDLVLELHSTKNTITANSIPGVEYSLDNIVYQDSNIFLGLIEGAIYTVYARYKETATTQASKPVSKTIQTQDKKVVDLFILAGQSNAVGTTPNNDGGGDNTYQSKSFPQIHFYGAGNPEINENNTNGSNYRTWTYVKPGLGHTATFFGPEMGMAEVFSSAYKKGGDREAAIIKIAWGGTSMYHYWVSPTSVEENLGSTLFIQSEVNGRKCARLYYKLISTITDSIRHFSTLGYDVNLAGLAWMQGEADAQTEAMVNSYQRILTNFIGDVRKDLNEPNLPFFIGEIETHYSGLDDSIRAIEKRVCQEMKSVNFIPGSDLQMGYYDVWHFAPSGAYNLGLRFGGSMLNSRGYSILSVDEVSVRGSLGDVLPDAIYATVHYSDNSGGLVPVVIQDPAAFSSLGETTIEGNLACSGSSSTFPIKVNVVAEPQVDGYLNETAWQNTNSIALPAFQLSQTDATAPQIKVSSSLKVLAGSDGLYFGATIKEDQFYTRYTNSSETDRALDLMSGIEILLDNSGSTSSFSTNAYSFRMTSSNLFRIYRSSGSDFNLNSNLFLYHALSGSNLIKHNMHVDGAVNTYDHPGNTAYLEIFIPFSLLQVTDLSAYRLAVVMRSSHLLSNQIYASPTLKADETPLSIYSEDHFSRNDIQTWKKLSTVLAEEAKA